MRTEGSSEMQKTPMIRRLIAAALGLGMAAGPVAVSGDAVDVDGGQLYYESCGSGPQAIVLLHDGLIDSSAFDEMWPILCKEFHVVRYDRRGYGKSPTAKGPYSQTEDLAAVIAAAKLERFTLVGFSNGGGIALDYALDHPHSVEGLVIVGGGPSASPPSAAAKRRENLNFLPILVGNVQGVAANWAKDPWYVMRGDDAAKAKALAIWKANPQNIRHLPGDPARPGPTAYPRLPGLTVPTLFLVGDHDFPAALTDAEAARAQIPNAKLAVVADCGHALQLERPRETAERVAAFIHAGR
jgi:pimeloyl-ACP methyl ester carboxylesterase